jgi:hypothetical protein
MQKPLFLYFRPSLEIGGQQNSYLSKKKNTDEEIPHKPVCNFLTPT